jgi:Ca2+-binding RTX toxin-like protein
MIFGDTLVVDPGYGGTDFEYAQLLFQDGDGEALRLPLDTIGLSDWIEGGAGDDSIMGQAGDDTITGQEGDDLIYGGDGNDIVRHTLLEEALGFTGNHYDGGRGTDKLVLYLTGAQALDPTIAQAVADLQAFIAANSDPASISGGGLLGSFAALGLEARNFEELEVYVDDVLSGPTADVVLTTDVGGAAYIPEMLLTANDFPMSGIAGVNNGGDGAVSVSQAGIEGLDVVEYNSTPSTGTNDFNYTTGLGSANVTVTRTDTTTLTGTGANEILVGDPDAETLQGGGGDDGLWGRGGNDSLDGGTGNDTLLGGQGSDTMTGGTGSDTFRWVLGDQGVNLASQTVYNFAGVTQATDNHFAWEFDVDDSPNDPTELDDIRNGIDGIGSSNEAENSEYVALASSNNTRWTEGPNDNSEVQVFWAQFALAEDVNDISQIDLLIEGRQDNTSSGDPAYLAVWNYTDSQWEVLDSELTSSDYNFMGSLTGANIHEYLDDSTNQITFMLMNGDDGDELDVDYVEVEVTTAGGASVTDTITDFVLGPSGDVIDLDDLLPASADNGDGDLDQYLQFSYDGSNTVMHVDHDGGGTFGATLDIVIGGVGDLTAGGTQTDAQIIQSLIDGQNLVT